jgi:hypothetical protein
LLLSLIKKRFLEVIQAGTITIKAYSRRNTLRNTLAPARLQSTLSTFSLEITIIVLDALFWKNLAFLSFQYQHG